MNYLEALEYFLQEYIFENDKTDILFNQKFNAFEFPGTDFVSAFRVSGIPILPPLVSICIVLLTLCKPDSFSLSFGYGQIWGRVLIGSFYLLRVKMLYIS